MRDYFIYPAQTNLELYMQAIDRGYSQIERRRLSEAYLFALRQVFPLVRGSGKPFIAHLVGSASLVMASGCSEDWVVSGLIHAVYQRRIPFQGGLEPDLRRRVVANLFGSNVDDLVDRYTRFESQDLASCSADFIEREADLLTLRLADELEDLSGHALALHGDKSSDHPGVRGGYWWRRSVKTREAASLVRLAQQCGLSGVERGFRHWLDFAATPEALDDMRTGFFSSVRIDQDEAQREGPGEP